jgi:hypothetical protein
MITKRIFTTGLLGASALLLPLAALAQPTLPTPSPTPGPAPSTQQAAKLNTIKTHGGLEIDRRLTALENVLQKAKLNSTLTKDNKEFLLGQLRGELEGLNAIKTKLASETALSAARIDVQSVWLEYRVYALLLPKARLIVVADRLQSTGNRLKNLTEKIEAKIVGAEAQGYEVGDMQVELANMKTQQAAAENMYRDMVGKVIELQPSDYVASHRVLTDYRDSLRVARTDFKVAFESAKAIVEAIKVMKKATPTPKPVDTASPAASPAAQ